MSGTISAPRPVAAPGTHLAGGAFEPALVPGPARLPRNVVLAHVVSLIAAFVIWAYLDRNLWFFGDEWDFLTRRGLHGAYFSIWAPHNEHWSVLPILLWRAIYSLEHLSSYWPYLVPLLLAHVAVVHLVWRRCLREGADPWVATALGMLLGLLGAGAEDLAWAFQIGFVSSLLFGFLAMEAADGPVAPGAGRYALPSLLARRRARSGDPGGPGLADPGNRHRHKRALDVVASTLALAALMCSTVGLAACAALAVQLIGRSGWRRALAVLAVPACAYVTWFALAGRSGLQATGDHLSWPVFLHVPEFVASNLATDLGHTAGWARAGAFIAAGVVAWAASSWGRLLSRHAAVLGGVIGAIVFYALAAAGRDRISPTMTPSRYAYVGAAFMMPALALVLTGWRDLVRTHRSGATSRGARWAHWGKAIVVPGLVILVAAATAGNVVAGVRFVRARTTYVRGLEDQIITTAALLQNRAEMARAVNTYPIWASGRASGYLTPHVLAQLFRTGLLPRPDRSLMSPGEILNDQSWLDVTALPHPLSHGRFRLLGSVGVSWSTRAGDRDLGSGDARPGPRGLVLTGAARGAGGWPRSGGRMLDVDGGLGPAWPAGPSTCAVAAPVGADFPHHFRSSLRFGLMGGERSGSLWLSLGRAGGKVLASLSSPWGLEGLPGRVALRGQAIGVPAGGYTWVSDTAPGDDLVLQLPAGTDAELCRLAPASGPRPRRHFVLSVFARGPGKPLAFAH